MTPTEVKNLQKASVAAQDFISRFDGCFIERTKVSNGLLLASVAELPIVLLGPPGTAKSMMIREFAKCTGKSFFQYLITRFTTPDELFGQFKISALKKDKLERAWKGTSVDAGAIFWDEVFKGGSALLNAMLTALNEKEADIGTGRIPMKYHIIAGASNELPEGSTKEMAALWDRWAFRVWVDNIQTDAGFNRLMSDEKIGKCTETLDWAQVEKLRKLRDKVDTTSVQPMIKVMKAKLLEKSIHLSDRKWVNVKQAVKANAVINGRHIATKKDLVVFSYMAWGETDDIPVVEDLVKLATQGNAGKITELQRDARGLRYHFGEASAYTQVMQDYLNAGQIVGNDESWDADCQMAYQELYIRVLISICNVMRNLNNDMETKSLKDFSWMGQCMSEFEQFTTFIKDIGNQIKPEHLGSKITKDSALVCRGLVSNDGNQVKANIEAQVEQLRKCVKENNSIFKQKTNEL
jgi:MoxR-like ATPase